MKHGSKKQKALHRIRPFVRLLHKAFREHNKKAEHLYPGGELESRILEELRSLDNSIVRCVDGALQDFLVPWSLDSSLYAPFQIKTTQSQKFDGRYTFRQTGNGVGQPIKYPNIPIVGVVVAGTNRFWWVFKSGIQGKGINVRIGQDTHSTLARGEGLASLGAALRVIGDVVPIRIADMRIASSSLVAENKLAYLIRQNIPGQYSRPDLQNSVVDDRVDYGNGFKNAQNKLCSRISGRAGVMSKHNYKGVGKHPYEIGDNDVYVFGYRAPTAVFIWSIPEAVMVANSRVGEGATKTLWLHVPQNVPNNDEVAPINRIKQNSTAWTQTHFLGRFDITPAQKSALQDGSYLEALV